MSHIRELFRTGLQYQRLRVIITCMCTFMTLLLLLYLVPDQKNSIVTEPFNLDVNVANEAFGLTGTVNLGSGELKSVEKSSAAIENVRSIIESGDTTGNITEENGAIFVETDGIKTQLPYSEITDHTIKGRNINVQSAGDAEQSTVINAMATGEVWVQAGNVAVDEKWCSTGWCVIPSTLNGWEVPTVTEKTSTKEVYADENACPLGGVYTTFGVRRGKTNIVPVLYGVNDANESDRLMILNFADTQNVSNIVGDWRLSVSEGKNLSIDVPTDSTVQTAKVSLTITDFGTDPESGTLCKSTIDFTLQIHEYSEPNTAPLKIGRDTPTNLRTFNDYTTVDALAGWVDPDGDTLIAQPNLSAQTQALSNYNSILNPNGQLVVATDNSAANNAQQIKTDSFAIPYAVCDELGATTPTTLEFSHTTSPPTMLETVNLTIISGDTAEYDLTQYVHNVDLPYKIVLTNVPTNIYADIIKDGRTLQLETGANETNMSFELKYTCTLAVQCNGAQGKINVNVIDVAGGNFAQKTNTIFINNEEDRTLKLAEVIDIPHYVKYNIQNIETEVKPDVGYLKANILPQNQVYIDAYLRDTHSQLYKTLGQIVLTLAPANTGEPDITLNLDVIIVNTTLLNLPNDIPIGIPDQMTVKPGEMSQIDVLANDLALSRQKLKIAPTYEQNATNSVFYSSGNSINFIAGDTAKPGDIYTFEYHLYSELCALSCQNTGKVHIIIADNNAKDTGSQSIEQVINDMSNSVNNSAQNTGNSSDFSVDQPVGIRDYYTGQEGETLDLKKFNPLANDYIPYGLTATLSAQNNADEQLTFGKDGAVTYYDLATTTYSTGENPEYGPSGVVVGSYTQRIELRIDPNSTISNPPELPSKIVQIDNVTVDNVYTLRLNDSTAQVDEYFADSITNQEGVTITPFISYVFHQNNPNSLNDTELKGQVSDKANLIIIGYSTDPEVSTTINTVYQTVLIPGLSHFKPIRKTNDFKTVKSGETLQINLLDEIKLPPGYALGVNRDKGTHQRLPLEKVAGTTQSKCDTTNYIITYFAPKILQNTQNIADLTETCGIEAFYEANPTAISQITFTILIIPEQNSATLSDNITLAPLAPKTSQTVNLANYIIWWGHSTQEISDLTVNCVSENATVEVQCNRTMLSINAQNDAPELANVSILTTLEYDGQSSQSTLQQPIKLGSKYSDIEIPLLNETLVIEEGKSAGKINVYEQVKRYLDRAEYYGLQAGWYIKCSPLQSPRIQCTDTDQRGNLQVSVTNNGETGFNGVLRFEFADRNPDNHANFGFGTLSIEYRALPFNVTSPILDTAVAWAGIVKLSTAQIKPSVPNVTQMCLNVQNSVTNESKDVCKAVENTSDTTPIGTQIGLETTTFSSYAELGFITKWQPYTFRSYTVNSVGQSQLSAPITATAFSEIPQPTVKWQPTAQGVIELEISAGAGSSIDTTTGNATEQSTISAYEISTSTGMERRTVTATPSSPSVLKLSTSDLHTTSNELLTISVRSSGKQVTSGDTLINTGYSLAKDIAVIVPDTLLTNDKATLLGQITVSESVTRANLGTNKQLTVDFSLSPNSTLAHKIVNTKYTTSITHNSYEFQWVGDCRTDTYWTTIADGDIANVTNGGDVSRLFGNASCDTSLTAPGASTTKPYTFNQALRVRLRYSWSYFSDLLSSYNREAYFAPQQELGGAYVYYGVRDDNAE